MTRWEGLTLCYHTLHYVTLYVWQVRSADNGTVRAISESHAIPLYNVAVMRLDPALQWGEEHAAYILRPNNKK